MDYYCGVCDKQLNINSKEFILNLSNTFNFGKKSQTNHTLENPDSFDIVKKFNEYMTNHV